MRFSRQAEWSGWPHTPPGDLPNPGIKPRSPALQSDSLLTEPPGKSKNTGMGSLSLQGILPTQELNPGLLHCRHILYQLNYQGSPRVNTTTASGKLLLAGGSSAQLPCDDLEGVGEGESLMRDGVYI